MTADTYQEKEGDDRQLSEVVLQVIAFTVLMLCGLLMYFLMTDSSTSLLSSATPATSAASNTMPAATAALAAEHESAYQETSNQPAAEPVVEELPSTLRSATPPATPPATAVVTATGAAASTNSTPAPVVAPTAFDQPLLGDAVYFDFASFELTANAKTILDGFAAKLRDYPTSNLVLKGHTDARGNPDANAELSAARAQACQNYLIAAGVDATRMGYAGLGARRPRGSNATATGRAENRRVDLVVVRQGISD